MKTKISLALPCLVLAIILSGVLYVEGFQPLSSTGGFQVHRPRLPSRPILSRWFSVSKSQPTGDSIAPGESISVVPTVAEDATNDDISAMNQAIKWRAEAERIRLEAEKMDSALTLSKIEALERKLSNQAWLEKNPDQVEIIQQKLESMNDKIYGNKTTVNDGSLSSSTTGPVAGEKSSSATPASIVDTAAQETKPSSLTPEASTKDTSSDIDSYFLAGMNPLNGYDQKDLDLYVPVVTTIEERMSENATIQEKLEAFRAAPELQDHFQEKIRQLIVQPMEDMQRLEGIKKDYLVSSSSMERKQLKREIDQLEKTMEDESPFLYSDSILLENMPVLTEEEVQQRLEAVGALHPVLQSLYKKRCGVNETGDNLRLAIELDHFEPQVQLLEQLRYIEPITDEMRHEVRLAILSLPPSVRNHFAQSLKMENGEDITEIIEALVNGEQEQWMTLQDIVVSSKGKADDFAEGKVDGFFEGFTASSTKPLTLDLPEYSDLDFMDRSRYMQEFLPSLTRLEMIHPPIEDITLLMKEVLDKKVYMVTSKPERVIGGYYIRGRNELSDFESTNNEKLVSYLQEKLEKSSLSDKLDLFYIQDPTAPTDEEYELGEVDRPVLVVTAKNREALYDWGSPAIKTAVSLLGIVSVVLFGAATTQMQPIMRDQVEAAAAGDLSIDLFPIVSSMSQVAGFILAIQLVHELAHRLVAWKDKFDIGLPALVPSIQMGLQGAITPFKSPPPSNKSMFDFAIAGPLAGLLVSFALLVGGLGISASMDMADANQLPVFPVAMLKSSALGGGIIEYFVGKGALMSPGAEAGLPLHPLAIAGFVGMLSNALALLPLGNTDGGRVSQVMFGRRGAYLVTIVTTLLLCALGLCGLDEPRILLVYVLFAMIWQRELEAPTFNEADELDFPRGLVGIATSIVVFLILLPML